MTKTFLVTAVTTGSVVKAGTGQVYHVQVTGAGSADTVITLYDNPTGVASGTPTWRGVGAYNQDFDCTDGAGTGMQFVTGITIVLSGTTAANLVITYN